MGRWEMGRWGLGIREMGRWGDGEMIGNWELGVNYYNVYGEVFVSLGVRIIMQM